MAEDYPIKQWYAIHAKEAGQERRISHDGKGEADEINWSDIITEGKQKFAFCNRKPSFFIKICNCHSTHGESTQKPYDDHIKAVSIYPEYWGEQRAEQ